MGVTVSPDSRFCVEPNVCKFSGTIFGVMLSVAVYAPGPGMIFSESIRRWCSSGTRDMNAELALPGPPALPTSGAPLAGFALYAPGPGV